ncbi:MAG: DUF4293 domain-containing protein [Bacteroidaceae bacterium]|nr:DUF4293 domain-containing protein [Bacteroidaceae bacterium]
MIQRLQSIYLLISAILQVICLSLPLGRLVGENGEQMGQLYNLLLRSVTGEASFSPWALFALLLTSATLTFIDIFLFKKRALQMRVASFTCILLLGYYAYLAFFVWNIEASYTPSITAAFPFVAIVLNYLAFRGILRDELLVKSLDRLR